MSTNSLEHDLVAQLDQSEQRLSRAQDRVDEFGEDDLQQLASVYREFLGVLERYEEDVTDDGGDYQTNIEFQSQIAEVSEHISDDLLLSETFRECDEYLQQKWFSQSDFDHVYEQLEPVADLVERIDERDRILENYRETRRDIEYRIRELDEEIDELERLSRLGNADLTAPTDRLHEPVEAYNDAVTDAFRTAHSEWSAREMLDFVTAMDAYPLVPFEQPPDELVTYIFDSDPGAETIQTLVEYADYSRSKLDHYVDDPAAFEEAVGGKQTYLRRLDADPLRIDWPPPGPKHLQYRCRELTAAVNRLDPAVVEPLRTVAALPRETEYERLRNSVLATEQLTESERDRIESEDIEGQLTECRAERDRLQDALAEYPER
jgi:tetratricopeptide (TPR) repeat protein